jgi:glycosyltransferase involved in cell wall biosynthesis
MEFLILDLLPFDISSRMRKFAMSLRPLGAVRYASLSSSGRFGISSWEGVREQNGVEVTQIGVKSPNTSRSFYSSIANIFRTYLPGFRRIYGIVKESDAQCLLVGNPVLVFPALWHRSRRQSFLILIMRERPGSIRHRGSLAAWFSRVERFVFRAIGSRIDLCVTVCESHAVDARLLGLRDVCVVRNVPFTIGPEPVAPSMGGPLKVAYAGSLYPGRGLEMLIDAASICSDRGEAVCIRVGGWASDEYRKSIRRRIYERGLDEAITLGGPWSQDEVRQLYQECDVGCVLYEAVDGAMDSLPNKLFEVMEAGRCVVATNLPETRSLVNRLRSGVCFSGTARELADVLSELARDREAVAAMGRRGRSAIVESLNWTREISTFLEEVDLAAARAAVQ